MSYYNYHRTRHPLPLFFCVMLLIWIFSGKIMNFCVQHATCENRPYLRRGWFGIILGQGWWLKVTAFEVTHAAVSSRGVGQ